MKKGFLICLLFFSLNSFSESKHPEQLTFISAILGLDFSYVASTDNIRPNGQPNTSVTVTPTGSSPAYAGGIMVSRMYKVSQDNPYYAGFEAGIIGTTKDKVDFVLRNNNVNFYGSKLRERITQVPFLFTLTDISDSGKYMLTGKIGTSIVMINRNLDSSTHYLRDEAGLFMKTKQLALTFGMEGKFRINDRTFFNVGFLGSPINTLTNGLHALSSFQIASIWTTHMGVSYKV